MHCRNPWDFNPLHSFQKSHGFQWCFLGRQASLHALLLQLLLRSAFYSESRPKVYTFCFPSLLSLNWSVTSALQTEIEQVLFGLLAGVQCITPSLHTLLLQLCTKAAAKAERVNWRWKCIPSHNGDEIFWIGRKNINDIIVGNVFEEVLQIIFTSDITQCISLFKKFQK